jgi:DUF917 family protein
MRELTIADIDDLTLGATLLGTGGGGDPYIARLMARQAIEDFGPVQVVAPPELPPDARVLTVAVIGAPTVIIEKVPSGTEFVAAVRALARHLGDEPAAILPIEVGGMNTLIPIAVAAELGLPVVDADGMRRAFPQIEMTVFTLGGIPAAPMSVADEKGNLVVFEATSNLLAERLARSTVITLGLANAISCYSLTASQVAEYGISGSMSYCVELGKRLAAVGTGEAGAYQEFLRFAEAREFFSGKIIDIERHTTDGFARGSVLIEHFADPDRMMRIEIQNELLLAFEGDRPVITAPDLICMLDHEGATPITTETLAYGQRVDVIGMPCAPEWHRDGMLELVGPQAFGYAVEYVPMGGVAQ